YYAGLLREEGPRMRRMGDPEERRKVVVEIKDYMITWKALPGFGNHSQGLAMDFKTIHDDDELGASSHQNPAWERSWLHAWLVLPAKDFGFHPYEPELWHWDWRP